MMSSVLWKHADDWYDVGGRSNEEVLVADVLSTLETWRPWYNVGGRSCGEVLVNDVLNAWNLADDGTSSAEDPA